MAAGSGGMKAIRAGTAMGSAASTSYRLGQATSGKSTVAAGLGGVASTESSAAAQGARAMASRVAAQFRDSAARGRDFPTRGTGGAAAARSEEHTSEIQTLMRISNGVCCLIESQSKITIKEIHIH